MAAGEVTVDFVVMRELPTLLCTKCGFESVRTVVGCVLSSTGVSRVLRFGLCGRCQTRCKLEPESRPG